MLKSCSQTSIANVSMNRCQCSIVENQQGAINNVQGAGVYSLMGHPSGGFGGWEQHTRGIGQRLLFQMGYEPGKGLGLFNQTSFFCQCQCQCEEFLYVKYVSILFLFFDIKRKRSTRHSLSNSTSSTIGTRHHKCA